VWAFDGAFIRPDPPLAGFVYGMIPFAKKIKQRFIFIELIFHSS